MEGPTLNADYNALLVKWGQPGAPCDPECEGCSGDMTGQKVVETDTCWLCVPCAAASEDNEEIVAGEWPRDREDFHSDG